MEQLERNFDIPRFILENLPPYITVRDKYNFEFEIFNEAGKELRICYELKSIKDNNNPVPTWEHAFIEGKICDFLTLAEGIKDEFDFRQALVDTHNQLIRWGLMSEPELVYPKYETAIVYNKGALQMHPLVLDGKKAMYYDYGDLRELRIGDSWPTGSVILKIGSHAEMLEAFKTITPQAGTYSTPLKDGAELIQKERYEQIHRHKRTIAYDQEHNDSGELIQGAIACLSRHEFFPASWDEDICNHIRLNKSEIDRLIVAGAFIAAEIDRLLEDDAKAMQIHLKIAESTNTHKE